MSTVALVIKTKKLGSDFTKSGQPSDNLTRIINLLKGFQAGAQLGAIYVQSSTDDPVAASATLTVTSAVATNAVTIGGQTLTASSTPSGESQWEIDGSGNDADAQALAAAINAHSTLSKVVIATTAANVITVTALTRGVIGNMIPISSNAGTIVASGAFLSGGTGGAQGSAVQIRG